MKTNMVYRIELIFEATRMEHVILSKEFQFNRQYWLEHLVTWSQAQFDAIGYKCSEKFYLFLENLFAIEPAKIFKECKYHRLQKKTY